MHGVVARTDLNGYSAWARGRSAGERALQLDAFFSSVVPRIELAGGVFFRDEGDCIVALFSDYFERGATFDMIEAYCMQVSARSYGAGDLSAKTCVSIGEIAIFQKQHEISSGDWSAEGEPFVRSARLEQAVSSTKHIVFFKDEYKSGFSSTSNVAPPGSSPAWREVFESLQVPGVGASGGWVDIARLEYTK